MEDGHYSLYMWRHTTQAEGKQYNDEPNKRYAAVPGHEQMSTCDSVKGI